MLSKQVSIPTWQHPTKIIKMVKQEVIIDRIVKMRKEFEADGDNIREINVKLYWILFDLCCILELDEQQTLRVFTGDVDDD